MNHFCSFGNAVQHGATRCHTVPHGPRGRQSVHLNIPGIGWKVSDIRGTFETEGGWRNDGLGGGGMIPGANLHEWLARRCQLGDKFNVNCSSIFPASIAPILKLKLKWKLKLQSALPIGRQPSQICRRKGHRQSGDFPLDFAVDQTWKLRHQFGSSPFLPPPHLPSTS